ncbi:MAG: undecaprenyl-diphosphate phosphatase [Sulfolobaceae archaeon]
MNYLYPIVAGIIQGITEWLPVSSKTQILLVSSLIFGFPISVSYVYGLFMEIGSITSATTYFRKDVVNVFRDKKLFYILLLITLFTGLVGGPLYYITSKLLLSNSYPLWLPMLILGLVLISEGIYIYYSRKKGRNFVLIDDISKINNRQIILIGIMQGLSALPGVSRSGVTISTMLLMGIKPDIAFKLSYLAYIPAAIGAFAATLLLDREEIMYVSRSIELSGIILAIIVAIIISFITIRLLLDFAKRNDIYLVTIIVGIIAILSSLVIIFF